MKNLKKFFRRLFLNYCWIGIIIILLTIIVNLYVSELNFIQKTLLEFFKTIGISIVVASVFSWASESYAFIDKIHTLLKSVVVKRDFLSNLDSESKMDALKSIIKPSDFEKRTYANVESYYDYYINQTMEMSEKNVRSHYSINARIFHDSSKNVLACEQNVNYRLYRNVNGFDNIKVGFTESSNSSIISYIRIYKSGGKPEEIKGEDIKFKNITHEGVKAKMGEIDLNKYHDENHLEIEIKTTDYGYDHWICPSIQALQPTDGLTYRIRCEGDIKIVNNDTFSQGIHFNVDKSEDSKEITISTYQWIHEGTGISIIASQ